jgi:uncharacterized protein (DUF1499 family)
MPVFSFSGTRPSDLGIKNSRFAPCPSSPNCVSSDAGDAVQQTRAFTLIMPASEAWTTVRQVVAGQARTKILTESDNYLYAECSSAFFGFVDDLELHLRPLQNSIAVRSASRLGYGDFGVNRKRVENLRTELTKRGVIR